MCVSGVQQDHLHLCAAQSCHDGSQPEAQAGAHTRLEQHPHRCAPPPLPPPWSLTLFVAPMTSTLLPRAPSMPSHSCMNSVLACGCVFVLGGGGVGGSCVWCGCKTKRLDRLRTHVHTHVLGAAHDVRAHSHSQSVVAGQVTSRPPPTPTQHTPTRSISPAVLPRVHSVRRAL